MTLVACTSGRCAVREHHLGSAAEIECRSGATLPSDVVVLSTSVRSAVLVSKPSVTDSAQFLPADQMRLRLDDGDGAGVDEQAQQIMQAHASQSESWTQSLSRIEQEAVRRWSLTECYDANASLRAGEQSISMTALDTALAKAESSQMHVLYRGVSFDEDAEEYLGQHFAVGAEVVFPDYLSTSHCPQVATEFATSANDGFIFEILTSKGAPITSQVGLDEFERLLPRNMRFQVVGIRDDIEFETDTNAKSDTFPVVQLVEMTD